MRFHLFLFLSLLAGVSFGAKNDCYNRLIERARTRGFGTNWRDDSELQHYHAVAREVVADFDAMLEGEKPHVERAGMVSILGDHPNLPIDKQYARWRINELKVGEGEKPTITASAVGAKHPSMTRIFNRSLYYEIGPAIRNNRRFTLGFASFLGAGVVFGFAPLIGLPIYAPAGAYGLYTLCKCKDRKEAMATDPWLVDLEKSCEFFSTVEENAMYLEDPATGKRTLETGQIIWLHLMGQKWSDSAPETLDVGFTIVNNAEEKPEPRFFAAYMTQPATPALR